MIFSCCLSRKQNLDYPDQEPPALSHRSRVIIAIGACTLTLLAAVWNHWHFSEELPLPSDALKNTTGTF